MNTATALLCSILETGCLEDKTVRELLDEFKLISIELGTKDDDPLDSAGKKIEMMTNLLTVLASISLYHASTLCSDSKGMQQLYPNRTGSWFPNLFSVTVYKFLFVKLPIIIKRDVLSFQTC